MEIHPGVKMAFRIICRIHCDYNLRPELSRKMASEGDMNPRKRSTFAMKKDLKSGA